MMMLSKQACYWLYHAVVVITFALLVPKQLVDGFSLVVMARTPLTCWVSQKKQFSSTTLHKNHHQPAFIRLDVRQKTLSAVANGERFDIEKDGLIEKKNLVNVTAKISGGEQLVTAPPVSFDKFLTMQDKRVVVTVQYSGDSGLRPYFLTVAKKLKASHPDVMIERRILAEADGSSEATFEVLVDGKLAVGKGHSQKQKVARVDMSKTRSVFVSMQELDLAISRARRRRRPNTVYGAAANTALESTSPPSPPAAASSLSSSGRW